MARFEQVVLLSEGVQFGKVRGRRLFERREFGLEVGDLQKLLLRLLGRRVLQELELVVERVYLLYVLFGVPQLS